MSGLTRTGKPRATPKRGLYDLAGQPIHPWEIDAGRAVPNNWDERALTETWAQRKARRAREARARMEAPRG